MFDKVIHRAGKLYVHSDELHELITNQGPVRDDNGVFINAGPARAFHASLQVLKSWVDISTWYAGYFMGETIGMALRHILT